MAIGAKRQLGVLLALLRLRGLWQPNLCHDPHPRNAPRAGIATTPKPATRGQAEIARYASGRREESSAAYAVPSTTARPQGSTVSNVPHASAVSPSPASTRTLSPSQARRAR